MSLGHVLSVADAMRGPVVHEQRISPTGRFLPWCGWRATQSINLTRDPKQVTCMACRMLAENDRIYREANSKTGPSHEDTVKALWQLAQD